MHVDADAFFVGCETSANPSLKGKPVAVGGVRRGVIASASYEARSAGIYTPMPTVKALALCPDLIVIPADFRKYESMSSRMFSLMEKYTPMVERSSVDEGYADLSGSSGSPSELALSFRREVEETLGLSISIGVASNRLVASIASKLHKPRNLTVVPPGAERSFLAPLSARWLPGVGEKASATLQSAGLILISDVARSSHDLLLSLLGSMAIGMKEHALGIDESPLVLAPPAAQSISRQETFSTDTTDEKFVKAVLRSMTDEIMAEIRNSGAMAQCVEVKVRNSKLQQRTASEKLSDPTDLETEVYDACDRLLVRIWPNKEPIRMVGLKLSKLCSLRSCHQSDLGLRGFSNHARRKLASAVDSLRDRYGAGSIVRGHRLFLNKCHPHKF